MVVSQFIYPIEGHPSWFPVLVIMDTAATNFLLQVFVWTSVFNSFNALLINGSTCSNQCPY